VRREEMKIDIEIICSGLIIDATQSMWGIRFDNRRILIRKAGDHSSIIAYGLIGTFIS